MIGLGLILRGSARAHTYMKLNSLISPDGSIIYGLARVAADEGWGVGNEQNGINRMRCPVLSLTVLRNSVPNGGSVLFPDLSRGEVSIR